MAVNVNKNAQTQMRTSCRVADPRRERSVVSRLNVNRSGGAAGERALDRQALCLGEAVGLVRRDRFEARRSRLDTRVSGLDLLKPRLFVFVAEHKPGGPIVGVNVAKLAERIRRADVRPGARDLVV